MIFFLITKQNNIIVMSLVNILGNKQYLSVGIFESKFQLSKILWTTLYNQKNIILTTNQLI